MKSYRGVILSSTACLLAVTAGIAGANAADLPSRRAAPVQYVRVCDIYGAGFFYIPGTNTCLRIGGYVRAEYDYSPGEHLINVNTGTVSQVGSDQDQTGMEIRGRVDIDGRTQTDWGTVQTVVHLRASNTDGLRTTGGESNFMTVISPSGNGSSSLTMERGFIRFAGLTAGVSSENASTMPSYMYSANIYNGFPNGIKQLAYTATFGGGFSSTIAIESAGDFAYNSVSAGEKMTPSGVPVAANSEYVNQWDTGYVLVGNVRLDQGWGYVQLAGLLHNDSATCYDGLCQTSNVATQGPTRYGAWGIEGSFGVKLPMIAPGDEFHFQAAYAQGWLGTLLSSGGLSDLSNSSNKRALGGVIRVDSNLVPTVVNSSGGIESYGETDGWVVYGLFTHYWDPHWRSNLALGYADILPPTANANGTGAGLNTQWGEGQLFQAAGQLVWSPIKAFDIGLDVEYLHLNSKLQNPSAAFVAAGEPGLKEDAVIYHLRLQRTF